jgi:multiple sugar transport system permease protein
MKRACATILVYGVLGATLFPFAWTLLTSLKPTSLAFAMPPVWVFSPTIESFLALFRRYDITKYIVNSVLVACGATLIAVVSGSLAAYSSARYRTGGRLFLVFILVTQLVPPIVIALPIYLVFQSARLIDTRWALLLAYPTFGLPFTVWLLRQFFQEIPFELEEAAWIDGATRFGGFWRVALPLAWPGIITAAIFNFLFSWNEFLYALVLTVDKAETVTIGAANFITVDAILWGEVTAITALIILPPLAFVLAVRKNIVRGLTLGAVKG